MLIDEAWIPVFCKKGIWRGLEIQVSFSVAVSEPLLLKKKKKSILPKMHEFNSLHLVAIKYHSSEVTAADGRKIQVGRRKMYRQVGVHGWVDKKRVGGGGSALYGYGPLKRGISLVVQLSALNTIKHPINVKPHYYQIVGIVIGTGVGGIFFNDF